MTLRPLDLVPGDGDGDAVEESLSVRLPADLPAETLRAVEAAMGAVARAVMAGRIRVAEAGTGSGDNVVMTFEVGQAEAMETVDALDALTALGRPYEPRREPAPTEAPTRAERRAAMVGRIRAANAETLERLADL